LRDEQIFTAPRASSEKTAGISGEPGFDPRFGSSRPAETHEGLQEHSLCDMLAIRASAA
jgi:hypothetical protein